MSLHWEPIWLSESMIEHASSSYCSSDSDCLFVWLIGLFLDAQRSCVHNRFDYELGTIMKPAVTPMSSDNTDVF